MLRRGFKFRLYPTPAQAAVLEQTFGVCRLIYNLALEQRRDHWRRFKDRAGRHISFPSQCRELTDLRRDYDWIAAVSRTAQEQALRDLDTAFSRFFKGVARYPQKAGLNRSILESGWAIFADMLTYKMEERGGHVVTVDPAYTSQTCSDCGVIDARSRESQARFACVACGHRDHADVNAAKNILRRNTAWLDVEATHQRACEASTGSQLAA